MPRKRKFADLSERCRICLARDGCMSDLFADAVRPNFLDLGSCTSVDVTENSNLPKNVCHVCLYKLEMWNDFKLQFVNSNKILLNHYKIRDQIEPRPKRKLIENENTVEEPIVNLISEEVDTNNGKLDTTIPQQSLPLIDEDSTTKPQPNKNEKPSEIAVDETLSPKYLEEKEASGEVSSMPVLLKSKQVGRRSRTTERRKASTKRWVERKKALIAATGEPLSDTESSESDEPQMSPVQKARAKTNSEKEEQKRKRVARALKNLEMNLSDKYKLKHDKEILMGDAVSDERRTRSRTNPLDVSTKSQNSTESLGDKERSNRSSDKISHADDMFNDDVSKFSENTGFSDKITNISDDNDSNQGAELVEVTDVFSERMNGNTFPPQQVRSEVSIGNVTYIISSTLLFDEPGTKDGGTNGKSNGMSFDDSLQDQNTDIIDAVQLRRINPKSPNPNKKMLKELERCLNIEVEGTEVEALQRVQLELANFLETEICGRLISEELEAVEQKGQEGKVKDSYETLDQQLKTIVEKVIKKNYETDKSKTHISDRASDLSREVDTLMPSAKTMSIEFMKAAMKSHIFQPKVYLKRLNFGKIRKEYHINNIHILENEKRARGLVGPLTKTLGKRRTVLPKRYNDFNVTLGDYDNSVDRRSESVVRSSVKTPVHSNSKNTKTPARNVVQIGNNVPRIMQITPQSTKASKQVVLISQSPVLSSAKSTLQNTAKIIPQIIKPAVQVTPKTTPQIALKSTPQAQVIAKTTPQVTVKTTHQVPAKTALQVTPKISQKIVANNVSDSLSEPRLQSKKLNLDKGEPIAVLPKPPVIVRQRHVCGLCGQEFDSKEGAEAHVRSHKVEATPQRVKQKLMRCKRCHEIVEARMVKTHICGSSKHSCSICKATFRSENLLVSHLMMHENSTVTISEVPKVEEPAPKPIVAVQEKQSYTCFVCDKLFTDEEELKDHLQKHCDDMSEDERAAEKEQFQCAICGETLQSEETLETHVEKHLFGEEDDNPDLINIEPNDSDKVKGKVFKCPLCPQQFDSELLLAMHVPAHEEEEAIAEWEKQTTEPVHETHTCLICEEAFGSSELLAIHHETHSGNDLTCILCEMDFTSIEELQNHVASHL